MMGRPKDYSEEILIKSREYLDSCVDTYDEFHKTRGEKTDSFERLITAKIPSIEGLALHLKISRDTVYDWEKKYPDFSYIIEELRLTQASKLINKGTTGEYNSTITKVLLSKHGYREAVEQTGLNGGPLQVQVVNYANTAPIPTKKLPDQPTE